MASPLKKIWAEGAREDLMRPYVAAYAEALGKGWRAKQDCLQMVYQEYHARISWRLQDHEEPELPLPEYNPDVAVFVEALSEEERAARKERIAELNTRIRRWLDHHARVLLG
ncbi:hypothetical protein B0H11DRAFT_2242691 [Mycena galericulata]|nr:hypothetical protein B0H11DRAFT_2242691 [Mycena galericulata]